MLYQQFSRVQYQWHCHLSAATWSVAIDGAPLNSTRPYKTLTDSTSGYSQMGAPLDVFLDDTVAQVYLNGNVRTATDVNCSDTGARLTLIGAGAIIKLDAWKMVLDGSGSATSPSAS